MKFCANGECDKLKRTKDYIETEDAVFGMELIRVLFENEERGKVHENSRLFFVDLATESKENYDIYIFPNAPNSSFKESKYEVPRDVIDDLRRIRKEYTNKRYEAKIELEFEAQSHTRTASEDETFDIFSGHGIEKIAHIVSEKKMKPIPCGVYQNGDIHDLIFDQEFNKLNIYRWDYLLIKRNMHNVQCSLRVQIDPIKILEGKRVVVDEHNLSYEQKYFFERKDEDVSFVIPVVGDKEAGRQLFENGEYELCPKVVVLINSIAHDIIGQRQDISKIIVKGYYSEDSYPKEKNEELAERRAVTVIRELEKAIQHLDKEFYSQMQGKFETGLGGPEGRYFKVRIE